jgi:uncharacterized membrane protein YgdD (TMEM256/DUF423 family)
MILHPLAKRSLTLGFFLLALAVLFGAFGAHGLKKIVDAEKLLTFETGVRYQFYHSFGLVIIGLLQQLFQSIKLNISHFAFSCGILLFSFNCYLYVLTGVKIFAMIVPTGGLLFILGWSVLTWRILKLPLKA